MQPTQVSQNALINGKLTLEAFLQLCGEMAGFPYVKIVVERKTNTVHFLNDHKYKLHAKYMADNILGISQEELVKNIDHYNKDFYYGEERPYYLGILSLVNAEKNPAFALETVEVDDMNSSMIVDFYHVIKEQLSNQIPLFFKPANYEQENAVDLLEEQMLPRIHMHELMLNKSFIPLNSGEAKGRLRVFNSYEEYKEKRSSISWFDILVMDKVPEDIPRVAGIINGEQTAPLSHTNVLANGWQIPNCIQIGAIEHIVERGLDDKWVSYKVDRNGSMFGLIEIVAPETDELQKPNWMANRVRLSAPAIEYTPIVSLDQLRSSDSIRYGTKAANLGEINHILTKGSARLLGFYQVERYPRPHLLDYLRDQLQADKNSELKLECQKFLKENISVPRGIAIPFSIQQKFLQSSPQIQQTIGKLKMALELDAKEVDSLSIQLQRMIRETRFSDDLWEYIDQKVAENLSGSQSFVVRSSSNAEDLEHFSAAGIYESYNHVTSSEKILKSIKEVWASLVSPRSVRLRHEVGIGLDDCYMGVIIQEEVSCDMGGVLVTTNPLNPHNDYRNVYLNASTLSPNEIVEGGKSSYQFLFNIVEGGGRTLVKEVHSAALTEIQKTTLKKLALSGKLFQSHFSPDYTYKLPVDIEWAISGDRIYLLQIRPYAME